MLLDIGSFKWVSHCECCWAQDHTEGIRQIYWVRCFQIPIKSRTHISMYMGETKLYETAFFHRSSCWSLGCSWRCEIVICCGTELLLSLNLANLIAFMHFSFFYSTNTLCGRSRTNTDLLYVCSCTVSCHVHHFKNSINPTAFLRCEY